MARSRLTESQRLALHYEMVEGQCWLWTGASSKKGYGAFYFRGRQVGAHVASYWIHVGDVPADLQVLHRCDVRPCVNPEHLFLGTQSDNMQDMVRKGRQKKVGTPQRGELNANLKLSDAQVTEIRALFSTGMRQTEIARTVGATKANVWSIVHNRSRT